MRIAIFDYKVIAGNPTGNCHLTLLRSLAREHKFTVFSVEFENPDPAAITWVRVPSPTRPLALLFVVFHLLAPLAYLLHKLRTGNRFDVVQSIESDLCFGGLVYSHFSHTTYLRRHGISRRGLRGILRWIDHWLHARAEGFRYPAAQLIVTPSIGLAEELKRDFHIPPEKVSVIANPIRVKSMERPADFDRDDFRRRLGFAGSEFVIAFAALGQFERKGLPLILESLAAPHLSATKLLVIGGEPDLIADYRQKADALGVGNRVYFAGMQGDVRPFLWSADAFVLPSAYESFSLVTYEAAAAGLPLLAPPLNGIRDLLREGENGFLITRSTLSVTSALERITALPEKQRQAMGENARQAAASFSEERFVDAWRNLYVNWQACPSPCPSLAPFPPDEVPMSLTISEGAIDPPRSPNTLPLVSVIIPCFNGVEFIGEAIESVLAQTHPRVEVIVVDDGSADGSAEAIAAYPVRCLHGQREGVSAARNRGIHASRGEYIVFLDADDRLLPNALLAGLTALTEHPECCMAVGAHNVVSSAGMLVRSRKKPLNKRDYYARLLKSNFIECICSVMFRREIFPQAGWFNTGLHAAEDYDLYLRLAREHAICCHGDIVSEYRVHQSNVSHDSELMLNSTLRVVYAQHPYIFNNFKRCCCFSYGLWSWRRQYGRQLTRQLATRKNGNGVVSNLEPWRTLARTYPLGVFVALAVRALPGAIAKSVLRWANHPKPSVDLGHTF